MGRTGHICINEDSFSVAIEVKKRHPTEKVLVLNFANPIYPGGGVRKGKRAQEGNLCCKSSLLLSFEDDLSLDKFNICTISNQLAKGLEFDAVIINGVNEYNYSSSSNLDMKLLYVAITRALHELDIVYNSELTKPLNKNGIYK